MIESMKYIKPIDKNPDFSFSALIKVEDKEGYNYPVSELTYECFDDSYQFVFVPFWDIIDSLPDNLFLGIPGINLKLRKDKYYRVNMIPGFLQMRTPDPYRTDIAALLGDIGLETTDPFSWLLRKGFRSGLDNLLVVPRHEKVMITYHYEGIDTNDLQPGDRVNLNKIYDVCANRDNINKQIFRLLASGANIYLEEKKHFISNEERRAMLLLLSSLLEFADDFKNIKQQEGIQKARVEGKYTGRKRISVDPMLLRSVSEKFRKGEVTEAEAMEELNISSRATFYRRLKELNEQNGN